MEFDIQMFTTIIGSLGFPIASFFLIFKELTKQNERHKEEIDKLNTSISNNTLALQQLIDTLNPTIK